MRPAENNQQAEYTIILNVLGSKAHVLSVNKDRILGPSKVFKQVNHKTYGPDLSL